MKKLLATLVGWGPWGLFAAALLDGAGLTIPGGVDVLLVVISAGLPEQAAWLALLTVTGSALGNFFLFTIARRGGQMFLEKRASSARSKRFRQWFDHYGLLTVFISALVPLPVMPMKIFVFCSGALGSPPVKFLIVFITARLVRYLGLAYLGAAMGSDALGYLKAHTMHLVGFAVALFLVLWLMIHIADRRRARLTATVQN